MAIKLFLLNPDKDPYMPFHEIFKKIIPEKKNTVVNQYSQKGLPKEALFKKNIY